MKESDIQIHQSIYESHKSNKPSRRELLLENKESYKNRMDFQKTGKVAAQNNYVQPSRQDNKPAISYQDPSFIKYYEENIQLKKKQQDMKTQIESLKNLLHEKNEVQRGADQRELALLAAGKRSLWDTKTASSAKKGKSSASKNSNETTKIASLLEIIDSYKAKLLTAQQQIQNLKRQKHLLTQDGRLQQKKAEQMLSQFKNSSDRTGNNYEIEQQLRNTTRLLQIEKQRNKFNEADIRKMETKMKTLEMEHGEVDELKAQNRSLEQKLLRLTQLPSFSHVTDKVDEERRAKEFEEKYKSASEKYNQLKNENIKTEAEIKVLRNQLIKVNYEADQLSKQNQKLHMFSFENPILAQLAEDQQLLSKVVYEIQSGKRSTQSKSELQRQSYDKILMEKEMLANELTVLRAKMNTMQENWREKERMSKIEKEEIVNSMKQQIGVSNNLANKIVSRNGVAYTDDVSMFSQDSVNLPHGSNYFDLFIGELHLLETMIATSFNIRNAENALILATVDFYNHSTETTRPVHGTHCNIQSQFSFKVTEDDFFFKYLNKGSFTIEIWGSEGNKRVNMGKITIDLRPLVLKSRKNLSPVVSSSAPIYMKQKVMGSINFVMRMRLPIFDQLQSIHEIEQFVSNEEAPSRKLIIQIQEGRGFQQNSNTFVYYPFRLEDYYTKTFKGSNPAWNYHKLIELNYNNDLKNYLRKNQLQLIVLDDNAVITGEGDSDVVGSAHLSLTPLLENKAIKERVAIMKGTQRVGQIDIKIYWHEQEDNQIQQSKVELNSLNSLKQDINQYLDIRKVDADVIFTEIDQNRSNMINFEQFYTWAIKVSPKVTYETANQFYKQFNQPLNKINFSSRLNGNRQVHTNEIAKELSEINKLFSQNTAMIKKKQSFEDFLKGKSIDIVSLDIDKSGNGRISKQELQEYFDARNVEFPVQDLDKEEIQIVKFIKKYQHLS